MKEDPGYWIVQHCVCEPTKENECWCQVKESSRWKSEHQRWDDMWDTDLEKHDDLRK